MNDDDLEKKVNHYLDFQDSTPNLGVKKVLGKTLTIRKDKSRDEKLKTTHYSTRSRESEAKIQLERQETIRNNLGKVKVTIKGVIDKFKSEREENDKLKKFINMIIKEHQQLIQSDDSKMNCHTQH